MRIAAQLAVLALREVAGSVGEAVGLKVGGAAVNVAVDFLIQRFTDQSQRLSDALERANGRAWQALEIALAGDSFWDRCKLALTRGEDQAFRRQVRAFLDITPLAGLPSHGPEFRQQCLREIRAARTAGLLTEGNLAPEELARQVGAFACFTDPQALLEAEDRALSELAAGCRSAGYPAVAQLLCLRPAGGMPLLVVAARYFFRREVETNQPLFQGLAWAKLERLDQAQESGFTSLAVAFTTQGQRLEEMLGDVRTIVEETHGSVLRIEEEMRRHGQQVQQLGEAVLRLLEQHQLQRRSLQPRDSLSIRGEDERRLVRQLVDRYRALPDEERRQMPGLLNGVGKLEVLAGDFEAAQRDFETAAALAPAPAAKAEAHYHAYRAALEHRDWPAALRELLAAVESDPARYAPFPLDKYQPERILGAGGFGVAFLCRHAFMNAPVVVKTLARDGLDQSLEKVFTEAQLLRQLDHPAVIRVSDCGYADAEKKRPYLVMDYFDGPTLEQHVREHGPLWPDNFRQLARQVADGLRAAHAHGILHRDVKPANLLLRKEDSGWQIKLIDFGLALRAPGTKAGSYENTLAGQSIAGTIDYAAPEQLGKLPGVAVGPAADVYGFGRLCCYALFQTPHPLPKQWRNTDPALVDLLENCMAESPKARPADFAAVLEALERLDEQPVDVLPLYVPVPVPVKQNTLPAAAAPTIAKAPPPKRAPVPKAVPTIAKAPPPKRAPAPDVIPGRRRLLSVWALVIGIAGFTMTLAVVNGWFKWSSSEGLPPPQARLQPRTVKEGPTQQDSVALPTTRVSKEPDVVPEATTPPPTLPDTKPRPVVSSPVGPEGKTRILGGLSDPIFEDLARENGLLIGLEVGLGKLVSNEIVRAIRPIYRTAKGEVRGKQYGTKLDRVISLKAKEGYAVGSITANAGLTVHGLSVRFVRVKGDWLDFNDSYESPWHGTKRSPFDTTLGDDVTPIIGIVGRTDKEDCTGLGLILRTKAPDNATDTMTPLKSATWTEPDLAKLAGLFTAIAKGVREDEPKRTDTLGGEFADQLFEETPKEGALLIGFEFGEMVASNNPVVGYVRPIFLTAKGERLGNGYGKRPDKTRIVKAKLGYAVGAIKVAPSGGGVLAGISVIFMKLVPELGKVDPADSYESKWTGSDEKSAQRVDSNGAMIVGIAGAEASREGRIIRLGFMTLQVKPADPKAKSDPPPRATWTEPELAKLAGLFAAIAKGVRENEAKRTNTLGGEFANQLFDETPKEGALLIGFEFGEMAVSSRPVVGYVRPIFLTAKGELLGKEFGNRPGKTRVAKGKPGYVVGAIKVVPSSGGVVPGISVIFMKLIPEQGKLDPSDSYESKWTGVGEKSAKRLDSEPALVVGFAGIKSSEGLAIRLGFMTLQIPPSGRQ